MIPIEFVIETEIHKCLIHVPESYYHFFSLLKCLYITQNLMTLRI